MNEQETKRLREFETRIREIAEEEGLQTTDILFEIVPAQRVLEGSAYRFPTNFSHWSFGRDYERNRTIYEHTGSGIPYEQVWNFDSPRAFCVETNPLPLNVLIIAHVYGHVDFFLANRYLQHGRSFGDIAEEARIARDRFRQYADRYGEEEVEKVIDAAMSIQWQDDPDPFAERPDEATLREHLLAFERAKLDIEASRGNALRKPPPQKEIEAIEERLKRLATHTPPIPDYDILRYLIEKSPRLKPWQKDILQTVRSQARSLAVGARTKILNEGWATYWHRAISKRLFEEGFLTKEEYGVLNEYHRGVVRENPLQLNPYRVGNALFEYIEERWDKGQFGREWEECRDAYRRAHWDTGAMQGRAKIFEIRGSFSDRIAIETHFTDEFIHREHLYIYQEQRDPKTGEGVLVIVEDRPAVIRKFLLDAFTLYGMPLVRVEDGNHKNCGELRLWHEFSGYELDEPYANRTLDAVRFLWGNTVHLDTVKMQGKPPRLMKYTYTKQ